MKRITKTSVTMAFAVSLLVSMPTGAVAATPDEVTTPEIISRSVTTEQVDIQSCGGHDDSANLLALKGSRDLCVATVTVTEERFEVTPEHALQIAAEENMTPQERSALVEKAAAGAVKGATWSHAYQAVFVKEIHKGTTYWDGDKAWIAKHRGLTGKHTCHAEGGWQVLSAVTVISCNKPSAGASADAVERFDLHIAYKGFPAYLNVGLHMKYTKNGVKSYWQTGG